MGGPRRSVRQSSVVARAWDPVGVHLGRIRYHLGPLAGSAVGTAHRRSLLPGTLLRASHFVHPCTLLADVNCFAEEAAPYRYPSLLYHPRTCFWCQDYHINILCTALAHNAVLRSLSLDHNSITDKGLHPLPPWSPTQR